MDLGRKDEVIEMLEEPSKGNKIRRVLKEKMLLRTVIPERWWGEHCKAILTFDDKCQEGWKNV